MRRIQVLVASAIAAPLLLAQSASAQVCQPVINRDTIAVNEWVVPQSLATMRSALQNTLGEVRLDDLSWVSESPLMVRGVMRRWPSNSMVNAFRQKPFPGVSFEVTLDSADQWTSIRIRAELLCEPYFQPPEPFDPLMDVGAFVLHHSSNELDDRLSAAGRRRGTWIIGRSCARMRDGSDKLDMCEEIVRRRPQDPEAYLDLAEAQVHLFQYDSAGMNTLRAVRLGGEQHAYLLRIGRALYQEERFANTAQLLQRAVFLFPDSLEVRELYAKAQAELQRWDFATAELDTAVRLGSVDPDVAYLQAMGSLAQRNMQRAQAQCRRALTQYQRTLRLNRRRSLHWARAGHCSSVLYRHTDAVAQFARAELLDPSVMDREPVFRPAYARSFRVAGNQPAATHAPGDSVPPAR